ncbi:MAG: hypothetical protein L6R36_003462 [Xanthoria steineri]|nr:MAG: hypothetical protein L6R36_003462 [Xanthoria steineri]
MFPCANPRLLPRYSSIPYIPLAGQPTPRQRFFTGVLRILIIVALTVVAITTICVLYNSPLDHLQRPSAPIPVIPGEFRTVGLVFYGRRSRVEILQCYLQQNLRRNGGLLDEVIFLARTADVGDLLYLDHLVNSTAGYSRRNVTGGSTYGQAWEVAERGTMYIKIDDDLMFIEESAISSLIATKVAHPEHLLISSNTINSPRLAWLHSHLGAIHPYLPEISSPPAPDASKDTVDWRPSLLPLWEGDPSTFAFPSHPARASNHQQRWLPVPAPFKDSLEGTPASLLQYESSTEGLRNWAIAAQEHYSFLQNFERGQLWRYGMSKIDDESKDDSKLWHMQGTRIQINLIAVWGDDVVDNFPVPSDDEGYFTVDLPAKVGRAAVVDFNAVAVHFAFRHQTKGMERTDLLARYKSLADERCRSR